MMNWYRLARAVVLSRSAGLPSTVGLALPVGRSTTTKSSWTSSGGRYFHNDVAKESMQVQASGDMEEKSTTPLDRRPLCNEPFAKNLFLGKFDKNMLVYPEVLAKDEVDELEHMVQPIEKFFFEGIDSDAIDRNSTIPKETLETLGQLGLFGQQIPHDYGGLELNATQYARLAEVTAHDASIAVTLGAHQSIGLKGILLFGTDEQKAKYLPKLATGEHIAAFALTEPSSGSDAASIQTRATLSEDGKHYLLNGTKIYISNGAWAKIFTVFARTEVINDEGEKEDKVTAFIVDRDFGGLTNGRPEDKLGIRGSCTTEIYFDNTPVPVENVLDKVGSGFKVAVNILNSGRFSMGSSGAGTLKTLIAKATEYATTRNQFGQKLMEFGLIKEKFAHMTLTTYVMESMAYLTAGIIDGYQEPDAAIESAIVKIYASEAMWKHTSECLQIFGGSGYMKSLPYERAMRDSRIMAIFEGTNEILRLFIALTCMQHAGKDLSELVKKMKNPLNNVGFVMKKGVERMQTRKKNPKLHMQLYNDVHPTLSQSAEHLEKQLIRFSTVVEDYLSMYRGNIIHEQMSLRRFADIVIDLYGMTAVLARASRSASIGLRNHEHELLLASTYCFQAARRIEEAIMELQAGKHRNGDEQLVKIAQDVFEHGGYIATHPLAHNW